MFGIFYMSGILTLSSLILDCNARFTRKDNMIQHFISHKKKLLSIKQPIKLKPEIREEPKAPKPVAAKKRVKKEQTMSQGEENIEVNRLPSLKQAPNQSFGRLFNPAQVDLPKGGRPRSITTSHLLHPSANNSFTYPLPLSQWKYNTAPTTSVSFSSGPFSAPSSHSAQFMSVPRPSTSSSLLQPQEFSDFIQRPSSTPLLSHPSQEAAATLGFEYNGNHSATDAFQNSMRISALNMAYHSNFDGYSQDQSQGERQDYSQQHQQGYSPLSVQQDYSQLNVVHDQQQQQQYGQSKGNVSSLLFQ